MKTSEPLSLADRLLALRRIAIDHFREDDWQTLAGQTSTEEIVNRCDPPLGRMNWGEDAYAVLVLEVLERIAAQNESNLAVFEVYAASCTKRRTSGPYSSASLLRLEEI